MKFKLLVVFLLSTLLLLNGMRTVSGLEKDDNAINYSINRGLEKYDYKTYSKPNKLPLYNPLSNIIDNDKVQASIDVNKQEFILSNKSGDKLTIDLSMYDFPVSKLGVSKNVEIIIKRNNLTSIDLQIDELSEDIEIIIFLNNTSSFSNGEVNHYEDRVELLLSKNKDYQYKFNYGLSEEFKEKINELSLTVMKGSTIIKNEYTYTEKSIELFKEIYDEITILSDKIANNKIVLIKDLEEKLVKYDSIESSLERVGDFTTLIDLINQEYSRMDSDWYTEYATLILLDEIDALYEIIDSRISTSDIAKYVDDFSKFIDNLDKIIEMDAYNKFLNFVKDLDLNLYTDDSVAMYVLAKENHIDEMNLYDPSNKLITTIEKLDDTYIKLIEAYKNLVLKDIIDIEDEEEIVDDISPEIEEKIKEEFNYEKKSNNVVTSIRSTYYFYLLTIFISMALIIINRMYKKIK